MNLLNDEPPLPEPWSEDDQRPICYLFAFTAQECKWNGKNVHDHPHFGKFFNTIVDLYPEYPDLSDYDGVFDPDHFVPPRKIRCDNWANPPCSYIPNECSPKVTDVESLKGFCGFQDATTGMYGDNFDRCWDCPDKPEDCDWAIGNCLQECFGYEGSGCYGSECENSVDSGSDPAWDNSTEDPHAGSDPSSDDGTNPHEWSYADMGSNDSYDSSDDDQVGPADPTTTTNPALDEPSENSEGSGSASESGSGCVEWASDNCYMDKSCWISEPMAHLDGGKIRHDLLCGRLENTPRVDTPGRDKK